MINISQYHSEEYLLCQLWAERVTDLDNFYVSLVNYDHVQFEQILVTLSFYLLMLFLFFYVKEFFFSFCCLKNTV